MDSIQLPMSNHVAPCCGITNHQKYKNLFKNNYSKVESQHPNMGLILPPELETTCKMTHVDNNYFT